MAVGSREIVAIHPSDSATPYPPEVHHRIRSDVRSDYFRAAGELDDCVDLVSIQHEYGIWGGDDGVHVLDLADALDVPAVVTLHTVLREPTDRQRSILIELIERVAATVVMSRSAASLLTSAYGIDPARLDVIPHGVPDLPLVDPATIKPTVGLEGRQVMLSFGLLGPGKGYELAIDALPSIIAAHPSVCYVVVGATHPDLLRREGEAYRNALVARTEALGLGDHVRFVDRFVGRVELARWLEAADVFVTPYPNLDQIVSGTLSYAMGAGRAIVSTPYTYAAELLADDRGVLVPPGSPSAFATAVKDLLGDASHRAAVGSRAYRYSRRMVWSEVGAAYTQLFERVVGDTRASLPAARLPAVVNA